jgi:hypothetical protein
MSTRNKRNELRCFQFTSELHRPTVRRSSAKLVPAFSGTVCRVVREWIRTAVDLRFLDRSRCFFIQVAPHLFSRSRLEHVSDPLLRKSGSARNKTRKLWVCCKELWQLARDGVNEYQKQKRPNRFVSCEVTWQVERSLPWRGMGSQYEDKKPHEDIALLIGISLQLACACYCACPRTHRRYIPNWRELSGGGKTLHKTCDLPRLTNLAADLSNRSGAEVATCLASFCAGRCTHPHTRSAWSTHQHYQKCGCAL